ncbi:MAG: DUF2169 domain-containing protein [Nitrospirota bacterium]|nr:DUF2169 domain-containing protein [Nitrospirota bacterium]
MWMLENKTPFEVERTWIRDKEGIHHWIVVVKATYDIAANGKLSLSEKPLPPLYIPEYRGVYGESSLRYEADLVAMKTKTDVYLNGIAYAPQGKPCRKVKVTFQIASLKKSLIVTGERRWKRTLFLRISSSSPKMFRAMPITYEGAYGGFDQEDENPKKHRIDFRNPVGSGLAYRKRHLLGKAAPHIVDPSRKMGKGAPAGFGALASYWSPRKELAGTYDQHWEATRKPLLPKDYNPDCLQSAPRDQQVKGYLQGGEKVELQNLSPNGLLRFTLPKISLGFETYFGSRRETHSSQLVSVVINSEGPQLILVWQTSLRCGKDEDYLDKTVIEEKAHNQ